MLKILVSFALGPWGMKVLYFYLENAAIINSVVFGYGILLVLSHYNFTKIVNHLEEQYKGQLGNKGKKRDFQIDVVKGINEAKMFPLVSGQFSFAVRKASKENILRYLQKEQRWVKLTEGSSLIYE